MSEATEIVHAGFSRGELKQAFDNVSDPEDWRAEIDAVVLGPQIDVTIAAIDFFTATKPQVSLNIEDDRKTGLLGGQGFRVQCEGYRLGPAGDH